MKTRRWLVPLGVALSTCFATLFASVASAELKLPSIIGDNMVLQRDQPAPIWGWDEPGTKVTVTLGDQSVSATAGEDGKWRVDLPAMKAGGPHAIDIAGTDSVSLKNVLIGEVWLCSGQSNMEWTVRASDDAEAEIAAADHPRIRHIKFRHRPSDKPESDAPTDGGWKPASPETVAGFTAVGFFFGRELHQELDVPIGLIGSNWGGTRIEPWTPPVGFEKTPALKDIADRLDSFPTKNDRGQVNHQSPLALYNGMIHPLLPYNIRGAIWYQGESNNGEGMLYHEKMKALITGWRAVWDKPDMPFLFVQLAPYRYRREEQLPAIWEAQAATLSIPNTGMAVTTDISNVNDIHPRNKQDVGKRLALWALAKTYGKSGLVHSGPLYKSMEVRGDKIAISFDHVGGGLVSRDNQPLNWFTIAGADGNFVQADAEIVGDQVIVSSSEVSEPKAVRFGWSELAEPNLANKEGLPASPFRTGRDREED